MITILGAGGVVSNELVKRLGPDRKVRLVSRRPKQSSANSMAADLSQLDQVIKAVAGSDTAVLLAGLKYDTKLWQELWPRIMSNCIEAAKRANAKLIFFDNVYMYGKVQGPMTEQTPFNPCSKKGEIRAQIATRLLDEIKSGNLTALIARSGDFYGPGATNGVPNILVFDKLAKHAKPSWIGSDSLKHSLTYTPDAAQALAQLIEAKDAWNQTWHLPTAPNPLTGKEFIALAAKEIGGSPKYRVLSRLMIKIGGWFDPNVREVYEMLYQNEFEYLFDSSKFTQAFGYRATPYPEGIRATAQSYK